MKQQVSFLAKNTFSRNINSDEVNEIQDRSGYDIFNMDGQNRKKEKLSPIIQSNSGHHESLILQYANPQQLITPKNENFTQRLQPIAQTDLNKQTKSFRKLIVYFHQKDFIKRLLAPQKLTSSFTLKHFNLINDLGASFKYQVGRYNENQKSLIHQYISLIDIRIQLRLKFRTIKTQCKHYFQYIHNQIPLIEPMSNLKFFWDLICFGIRIYLIVIIPILMAFHHQNFIDQQYVPLIFVSIALIFDIIIRAFTVTYDQGLPVRDRYLLYKKQLNFSTLLELFSFIYTIIISLQSDNIIEKKIIGDGWPKFILVLQYIQVANILKFIDISQYSFKLSRMSTSIVELIKLITLILLVQHIFSCVWIVFGIQGQNTQQQSWLDKFEYDQWSYQFLQSFYFICVTTFTVGYGDLTPKNPPEQIFTIIYMFLCMLLFSYTVNTIGSILTQIKESSDKIKTKLTAINQYMHNKQISPTLQFKYQSNVCNRVREQLYFYLKQEVVQQVNEQSEIISMLPEELQHSLRTEAAKSLIYKCSFFNENFSNEILNQLMEDVNFQIFQPGATIQSKDEFFIHIIEQGQVEVLYKKKSIQTLEKFDYFGLEEFVTQQYNSNFVFKSNAFTSVLSIPYSHFHKILSQNDLENQKFQNLLTSQPSIQNYCFICKTKRHTTQFCSQVHFIPNREVVLKRYLYRKKQKKRVKQDRRIRQLQLNEVNIINGENQSKQIQFKNACQNQKNVEFIVNKFQVENQIALETLFPTIEQPVSVDSQSESENEDPDEVKDNSFSQQQQNSRRGSKQIPPISSNDLCQYQILDKLKKEKQNRFVPHQQAQLQMSQYGQINANTNININMKQQLRKLLLCKPGLFEYQEQKAQIQELNFFNDLKQKMNNLHLFPKTEQTQIEFWYKKIVNLKEDLVDMQDFETLKNYEVFNRQWNADLVVKKLGIKLKKFRGFKKLKRYLLFPYLYVNKYLDKKDSNDQNKPVEKSKKKRPTRPKVIKKTRVSPKI